MITLEQFINLCNLEGAYFLVAIEERENCWHIKLGASPKIGRTLDRLEKHYEALVKEVTFSCEEGNAVILLTLESSI